jgi:lipid-binding SYLF domain-containing protein
VRGSDIVKIPLAGLRLNLMESSQRIIKRLFQNSKGMDIMKLKSIGLVVAAISMSLLSVGCSTAPKAEDQAEFRRDAQQTVQWFKANVRGLDSQISNSAGYVVYPTVGQWGIFFGGGQFGRGLVSRGDGSQIGWGALNTSSAGLQVGGRGFKMLVVFEDQATLDQFMENKLTGSVAAVSVAGDASADGTSSFTKGVVIYEGGSTGLMAGVNVGLNFMRYKGLDED